MPAFVILSEAKNLMDLGTYTSEILRLTPQNDVVGQPLRGDLKDLSVLLHFPYESQFAEPGGIPSVDSAGEPLPAPHFYL